MIFLVKARHIGTNSERTWASFDDQAAAEQHALALNCKPFTPYYAWVEKFVSVPAQNSFIGGR